MCMCACCYQLLSSKISEQGPVAKQDSMKGYIGKGPFCSMQQVRIRFPMSCFTAKAYFPGDFCSHPQIHSTGHVHKNAMRSLASSTITLKSAHAQRQTCTKMESASLVVSKGHLSANVLEIRCVQSPRWQSSCASLFNLNLCKAGVKTQNCSTQFPSVS